MHIMVGIPPHIIMAGMPMAIMPLIISQQPFIISICAGSIGIILQTMPSLVISMVIRHIMGRMPIIMGMGIGIMPGIGLIPFIMEPIMPGIIIGMGIVIGMAMGIGISGIAAGVISFSS